MKLVSQIEHLYFFHSKKIIITFPSKYSRSLDNTNSISTILGIARLANRAILPKFLDLTRFWINSE